MAMTRFGQPVAQRVASAIGEVFLTVAAVIVLFVVYQVYVTDYFSERKQADAQQSLDEQWRDHPLAPEPVPVDGESFAKLYVPAFGLDYRFTVQEGTRADTLAIGPGHYRGSALPGQSGNFAVAGHRVGKGSPFNDLELIESCDAIVVETSIAFYIYRVLPFDDDIDQWTRRQQADPRCREVPVLRDFAAPDGGRYSQTSGRRIVEPDQHDAVAAVPFRPDEVPELALMALTTCHPQFSDRQRLIITAILIDTVAKTAQGPDYPTLLSTTLSEA
ncbi:class E sortase [Nocardia sp. IBHARD005]|uniref:class E sortase n=1 Tax=Nocardia sp. IBHARD005 TaxID=3457765 RepID=UPI004058C7B5